MLTDGMNPTPLDAHFVAALADRYRVERAIGAGGMATVYVAHDIRHDRKVALKVLRPELAAVIGADRFLAEIRTTANLQHPHILALFDSGQLDGTVFYVMPFVEGESLRDRLEREKQLPIDDAIRIAKEVAGALDYAHRHGVIHRDIKPENILLHDGQALVADFGIALAASRVSDTRLTETGMSLGTPTYMSPEQAMGERTLDARADVYALGCVLFEMLAGEPPFTGPTAQSIVARVLTEEPRSLVSLRRSVPAQVDDAVRGALEKLPADRIGSTREFAEALDGMSASAKRRAAVAPPARARDGWRILRHPVVAGLGVLVLGLGAVVAWQVKRTPETRAQSVVRLALNLPTDVRVDMYSIGGANVTISPDGRRIVVPGEGVDGTRSLYVRSIDDLDLRAIPGTAGGAQPAFSPDGRWIAYLADGNLMRVSPEGGAPLTIAPMADVSGFTWADNKSIVFPRLGVLMRIPITGGSAQVLSRPDTSKAETLQEYPVSAGDGEHLLYTSWDAGGVESAKVGVVSLSTGKSWILDVRGVTPLGIIDGHVIYVTANGDLLATPVDLAAGRSTGPAVTLMSGVLIGTGGVAKATLSASGSLVYLAGAQASQIMMAGISGGAQTMLADVRGYGYPRFSPDGKRIAMTIASGGASHIWIYDMASRTPTRLTSGGSLNERPEWTPDGTRLVFRSDRDSRSSIWSQPVNQSEPASLLLASAGGAYFEAVITPDAKYVVFQSDTTGADVEYRALTGDGVSRPIATSAAAIENSARVSPDGRWVTFVTDESGSRQVVVQPFPGPGSRVQISTTGGTEPVWSRDSRRLVYRGRGKFVAADLVTSPTLAVSKRTELIDDLYQPAISPHANYDLSPDGTKLLVVKGVDAQRLILVHNWTEEVRTQLRASTRRTTAR